MTKFFTVFLFLAFLFDAFPAHAAPLVKVGAQVLQENGYSQLAGKRIGLITNHTAVVDDVHTADLMHASGKVQLVAMFAPEHGMRGLKEDGENLPIKIHKK